MKLKKRILCIVLSVLMLLSTGVLSAFAESTQEACPLIYVHGFMGSPILENKDDPNSKVIWPPDVNAILEDVKAELPGLTLALTANKFENFGDMAVALINPYFEPNYLAKDGTCPNNSGVYFRYPSANSIPKNGRVNFCYDWRLDPLQTAESLNKFIIYVLNSTGAQKVNLVCHSLGGIIVMAYLTKYGDEKVKGVCFNTTAIYGESYTGNLMRGDIVFDPDSIEYYMRYILEGTEYDTLFTELIGLLNQSGLLRLLAVKANGLTKSQKERVCREVLLPLFGNWLTIWSMVPDKDMETAKDMVFNQLCAGEDYTELRAKIDAYNTTVRANRDATLEQLNNDANVYVISRYGYSSVPVTSSFKNLSDGTVDTMYSSFGATTSDYDSKLTKEQIGDAAAEYISPDHRVNAATCKFPEQTWFVRNMKHDLQADSLWKMMELLLAQNEQATVSTFEQYPRFLVYDAQTDTLSPDTAEAAAEPAVTPEKVNRLIDQLKRLFEVIKQFFMKLFK